MALSVRSRHAISAAVLSDDEARARNDMVGTGAAAGGGPTAADGRDPASPVFGASRLSWAQKEGSSRTRGGLAASTATSDHRSTRHLEAPPNTPQGPAMRSRQPKPWESFQAAENDGGGAITGELRTRRGEGVSLETQADQQPHNTSPKMAKERRSVVFNA